MTEIIHIMTSRHDEKVTTTKNSNSRCNRIIMIIEAVMVLAILIAMQLIIIMIIAGGVGQDKHPDITTIHVNRR